jgi:hypothetical protein
MRDFISFAFVFLCCFNSLFAQNSPSGESFISPLNLPFSFSGNFGELRPSHFHTGLDFRTQGQTGIPVHAVKDGYISRISVSPTGYGNVLYLNHLDGNTTVYGHLDRFTPLVSEYVKDRQYYTESFQVNLTLSPLEFSFKKGDIIAWSGNSGGSAGPHLHFEIRNTKSERAMNPLFYIPGIKDNSAPKISSVYIYPLSENSYVNVETHGRASHEKKRFEPGALQNANSSKKNPPIELYGKIGFGIQAGDFYSGTGIMCGIYSAALLCDGKPVFGFKMNNLSFDNARFANSQVDYEELEVRHRWVQRLYRQPGNELDIYDPIIKDGILDLEDEKLHNIEIIVSDAFNNKSSLKFKVYSKIVQIPVKKIPAGKEFFYNKSNVFENDDVRVKIPKGALYDNLSFVYSKGSKSAGCYSELHGIHLKTVALQKPYSLSIKVNDLPEYLQNKALIVNVNKMSGKKSAVGGTFSHGWVSAEPTDFGTFTVSVDTSPPSIVPLNIQDKKTLTDNSKLRFTISDNLSGIKSYRGEIDNKWVLFEFDAKSKIISYTFDKSRMVFGKSHHLSLVVIDNKDNRSEYKAVFFK